MYDYNLATNFALDKENLDYVEHVYIPYLKAEKFYMIATIEYNKDKPNYHQVKIVFGSDLIRIETAIAQAELRLAKGVEIELP